MLDDRCRVAPLSAHAGHENREVGRDRAHVGELLRVRGSDDEATIAPCRPVMRHHLGHVGVHRLAVGDERLDVVAPRIAGAAERDHTAPVLEVGRHRVGAEVRIHGDRVSSVAPERLAGIVLGRGADVATLGVEDQRHVGVGLADIPTDAFQRLFLALAREVGDLWLERTDEVGGGIDDRPAEGLGGSVHAVERKRHAGRVGVETDTQHRRGRCPRPIELTEERHLVSLRR